MRSDARKRLEVPVDEFHDAALTELRAATLEDVVATLLRAVEPRTQDGRDTHDAGYVDGWNAAARYFAASFNEAAAQIRAAQ